MSQIEELRRIIVGDNAQDIAQLKDRIESVEQRTKDVAEVLSPAIDQEIQEGGDRLIGALQKPVSRSLKNAVRQEPEEFAEILYPVMAPSIRRAIQQAIASLLVTINRTVESATTVTGVRTRLQSWRTGIPYAELALRQSLVFNVEHLFLIHRESGMLIADLAAENAYSLDSDAVSAMFSAIQSFVLDSFASHEDGGRLTDLKVGSHNIKIAHGPHLMLACVIQGEAPEAFKNDMYDCLDRIRYSYAHEIASFSGDASTFVGVEGLLQALQQIQIKEIDEKTSNVLPSWLIIVFTVACLWGLYSLVDLRSKRQSLEYLLESTPGVVATDVQWRDSQLHVEGLMDPDAQIPYAVLHQYGLKKEDLVLNMTTFRSLEPSMELQRFKAELSPPVGVYFAQRDRKIYLYGEAPIDWLISNSERIRQLTADRRIDASDTSASLESVSDWLRMNFSDQELQSIQLVVVPQPQGKRVEIRGQMSFKSVRRLADALESNVWLKSVVEPYVLRPNE